MVAIASARSLTTRLRLDSSGSTRQVQLPAHEGGIEGRRRLCAMWQARPMSLPEALTTESATFRLRRTTLDDVPAAVDLIANDPLGRTREILSGDLTPYRQAFHAIDSDPAHLLVVAVDDADAVVGTMQLIFIPGLARQGALRAQIEAVHVREDCRSLGLGRAMMTWAIDEARRRGCALVQLTSHKKRTDAHRFYARLGFEESHEGFKLVL